MLFLRIPNTIFNPQACELYLHFNLFSTFSDMTFQTLNGQRDKKPSSTGITNLNDVCLQNQAKKFESYLRPASIFAIFPLLLVTNTSLSSHTMQSMAARREEQGIKDFNSSPARASFVLKFGKSSRRGCRVASPP